MHPNRFMRMSVVVLGAGLVSYWLFADTVSHYRTSADDPNRIRFSYWGGFTDHEMWREIIAAFEVEHPGLMIKPEWLPLSGYTTKLDQQFVAGTAPDVILFQDEPFPRYAAEQFVDLSGLISEDVETCRRLADCWPTAVSSFEFDGAMRGLPINGGNVLIYCNVDAFERASRFRGRPIPWPSPGWTLEEFVELCRLLTLDEDGDGSPEQFGFLQPHWVYYLPFIWAHGARLLDESRTRWTLEGNEARAAFAMYADLRHRDRVTPAPIEYAGQNSDTAFLSGRVAMCVNGPWFQVFLNKTALKRRYRVVAIPGGSGGHATRVTWDGLCLYAKQSSERKANAWKFARFVLVGHVQEIFARYQRAIPARRSSTAAYVRHGGGGSSPAASFVDAMASARVQPITPHWQAMHRAVRRHLTSVILEGRGRKTPDAALRALAAEADIRRAFGSQR
ncbi:MAG: sugar ABC transporter substrate-binding protein [Phycisphaerales bacterium]|nr:sugar ABC transporter substrate-binding protein [Phycisphaerales bacterium]